MLILLLAFTSPLQSSDFITFQRLSALKIRKHKAEAGRVSMHHCKHFWRAELWKQRQSVWKIKENFLPSEAGRAEEEMCLSRSLEPSLFFNFTAKQVQLRKLFSRLYIIALCPRHHWCNTKKLASPKHTNCHAPGGSASRQILWRQSRALSNLPGQNHSHVVGHNYSQRLGRQKKSYQKLEVDVAHTARSPKCHKKTSTTLCKRVCQLSERTRILSRSQPARDNSYQTSWKEWFIVLIQGRNRAPYDTGARLMWRWTITQVALHTNILKKQPWPVVFFKCYVYRSF